MVQVYDNKTNNVVALRKILPEPKGYRILIALPSHKKDGKVLLPDSYKKLEETASIVGHVLALGEGAYKDPHRFPEGPWCQEGDWVMFRSYSGTRFKIKDQEFRLLNDDSIEAVVADPRLIERA